MQQMKLLSLILLITGVSYQSMAAIGTDDPFLLKSRQEVIKQYVDDLASGNAEEMKKLFEPDGIVVSTSRGTVKAEEFFDSFLPLINQANTQIHARYSVDSDLNRYGVRFHFDYVLHDGEQGGGEYVDEFVFLEGTSKLSAVYMFENLKFPEHNLM
ncbi:nuclear transport factor 2 family protein [Legionella quateirensis]|uniref:SnoaL-like domain-containing protein n=1 Tax=Legionella quateirensis TaxID=45072 RepID=A0A378KS03_9GAMM|nr:nuclear transport factor 2 family protein [Legionella quateirensis]KTD51111.1 hypothetical protein Lqua_1338 [Legionella quateirensis]STY17644.1 Uncharacterised protein [Legionella quateirensis]